MPKRKHTPREKPLVEYDLPEYMAAPAGDNAKPNLDWLYMMAQRFVHPFHVDEIDAAHASPAQMVKLFQSWMGKIAFQAMQWIREGLTAEDIETLVVQEVRTYWSDWREEYRRSQIENRPGPRGSTTTHRKETGAGMPLGPEERARRAQLAADLLKEISID